MNRLNSTANMDYNETVSTKDGALRNYQKEPKIVKNSIIGSSLMNSANVGMGT